MNNIRFGRHCYIFIIYLAKDIVPQLNNPNKRYDQIKVIIIKNSNKNYTIYISYQNTLMLICINKVNDIDNE